MSKALFSQPYPHNYHREDGAEVRRFARNFYDENMGFGRISETVLSKQTEAAGHIGVTIMCQDIELEPIILFGAGDETVTHDDFMQANSQLLQRIGDAIPESPTYQFI